MLPKHMEVTNCPKCGRKRPENETGKYDSVAERMMIRCSSLLGCGYQWYEQPADGSAPVEVESKSVRVVNVEPEAQHAIRVHRIELHTNRYSYVGHHLAEQLNIEPGDTGSLAWRPDPEPKLEPEPVFAVQREETKLWWECSRCRVTLPHPARISIGTVCPKCARTFNRDPEYLK